MIRFGKKLKGASSARPTAIPARIVEQELAAKADSHVAAGDRARDEKQWKEAAKHYQEAVETDPQRAAIWVQLGHARKESNDRQGGLEAYKKAWKIERCSDTALQIGHVLKLLGDVSGAKSWYKTALTYKPISRFAARELLALGENVVEIERLAFSGVEPNRKTRSITNLPQCHLWDCTSIVKKLRKGSQLSRTDIWQIELAQSIQELGVDIHLVALSPDDSGTLEKITPKGKYWSGELSTFDISSSFSLDEIYLDIRFVIFDNEDWQEVVLYSQTLSICRDIEIILIVHDLLPVIRPEWFVKGDCQQYRLSVLSKCSDKILVFGPSDRRIMKSLGAKQTRMVDLDCVQTASKPLFDENSVAEKNIDLLLASSDPIELDQFIKACVSVTQNRLIVMATDFSDEALSDISASLRRCLIELNRIESLAPDINIVRQILPKVTRFIVPSARRDADIWMQDAVSAGIPLIVSGTPRIFSTWSRQVASFIDPSVSSLKQALEGRYQNMVPEVRCPAVGSKSIAEILQAPNQPSGKRDAQIPLALGQFFTFRQYDNVNTNLETFDAGKFRCGPGWGRISSNGAIIRSSGADLRVNIRSLFSNVFVCKFLLKTFHDDSRLLSMENWAWLTAEFSIEEIYSDVMISVTRNLSLENSLLLALGFIIYPKHEDAMWFQFQDRAARGLDYAIPHSIISDRECRFEMQLPDVELTVSLVQDPAYDEH